MLHLSVPCEYWMQQSVFLMSLTLTLVFLNIISFCWFLILLFSSLNNWIQLFLFLPSKLNIPFYRTVLPFLAMPTDRFCFMLTHLSTGCCFFLWWAWAFPSLLHLCFPYFCFLPLSGTTTTRSSLQHILRNGLKAKMPAYSLLWCQIAWCATEIRTFSEIFSNMYIFEQELVHHQWRFR